MDKMLFVFMKHGEKARTLVHFLKKKLVEISRILVSLWRHFYLISLYND